MTDQESSLRVCPRCGLPFRTADNLSLHLANWHSDKASNNTKDKEPPEPADLLWRELVHRIFETPDGFQSLSQSEKLYYSVCELEGEVYNGGFHQYFFNSSGSRYAYASLGLENMGALQSLALLRRAQSILFGDQEQPIATSQRRQALNQLSSGASQEALRELDQLFWEDPDNLPEKISGYAKSNGLF